MPKVGRAESGDRPSFQDAGIIHVSDRPTFGTLRPPRERYQVLVPYSVLRGVSGDGIAGAANRSPEPSPISSAQLVQIRLTAYTHGVLSDLAAKALTSSSPPQKGP